MMVCLALAKTQQSNTYSTVVFCHFWCQCDTLRPYPILWVKGKRLMQLPIVAPAPIVTAHADIFRDLFENRCQFRHFQHYLTGLIVLDNKSSGQYHPLCARQR